MTPHCHDVIVVGDGPAGLALGAACDLAALDVLVVGQDRPWTATYGTWVDDVPGFEDTLATDTAIDVVGTTRRTVSRRYATFHHDRLRAQLDRASRVTARVVSVQHRDAGSDVVLDDGTSRTARVVVQATGSPANGAAAVPAQTAYGLVLDHRPSQVDGDAAVLMDWRPPGRQHIAEPTFLYVVALDGGQWLVEETSLARRSPMSADELRRRLASRLGADLTDTAARVEHVVIPMRPGVPNRSSLTVGFGAAAGYVHPATGYSVSASLRAAPRVAAGIAESLMIDDPRRRALTVWGAVWPGEQRRARALHDYGLAALLRLPADDVQAFFDAFFALPVEVWSAYLRVDTDATTVSRVMTAVFSSVPWRVRRRLAMGSPVPFARLLR
ncbi:MAG: lycopene cyclase family protein [Ilumatobacteraceae bacterium]